MIGRLWYPQLDIYDAIRRMAGLLTLWSPVKPPSQERLFIADFYLANPPLLHNTHMPSEVRRHFRDLKVPRPGQEFVSYPSAPILFQKMDEVQRQAFRTLSGKGLIDLDQLEQGTVRPSAGGAELFESKFLSLFSESEHQLASFLVSEFAPTDREIAAVRRSTGLRRLVR
ncbi:MAG: hypothetical protein KDC26_12970 [Armatimonadetes bacterium]|nr:hypothetical protein [Armatimonadota bacterium]